MKSSNIQNDLQQLVGQDVLVESIRFFNKNIFSNQGRIEAISPNKHIELKGIGNHFFSINFVDNETAICNIFYLLDDFEQKNKKELLIYRNPLTKRKVFYQKKELNLQDQQQLLKSGKFYFT